jgi:hypothetical protein
MLDIIKISREWLNTPWQHNQKIKHIGVDCVNFLEAIAEESNLKIEKIPKIYGKTATNNEIELFLNRNFKKKITIDIEPTNIILYSFSGYNNHVALATSSITIIHANSKVGKVVEHQIDGIWRKHIKSVYIIS